MSKTGIIPKARDGIAPDLRIIASVAELRGLAGQEVAVSGWFRVSQERIGQFAEATEDRQWIHLDAERSRLESPFGGTVAHGFLTLSLLPMFLEQTIRFPFAKMSVNYGLNKVRFPAPVPAGSRLRARIVLLTTEDVEGGVQMIWKVTMEREGGDKPVCTAEAVLRCYM